MEIDALQELVIFCLYSLIDFSVWKFSVVLVNTRYLDILLLFQMYQLQILGLTVMNVNVLDYKVGLLL